MRLRAVGHSRGRCRPAGCWWVWVYQRRRSASSTGRLWPESPGDSGPCPAWRGQLYRQPATRSCERRTWKRNITLTLDLHGLVRGSTYLFMCLSLFYNKDRLMEQSAHSFFSSSRNKNMCSGVLKWKMTCNVCRLQAGSPSRACSLPWDPSQIFSLGKLETFSW